jgi:hypothetical protein
MRHFNLFRSINFVSLCLIIIAAVVSCGQEASPEGRMSLKLETLQKEMRENAQQQNKAMLDSLGKIREAINELKATDK